MAHAIDEEVRDLAGPEMAEVVDYLSANLSEYRQQHIGRVMRYSWHLATRCLAGDAVSRRKAVVAALIHDITKEEKKEFHFDLFRRHGMPEEYFSIPAPVLHSKSAPLLAKERFHIDDPQVAEAAAYHTTGHPDMGPVARVVFAADMLGSLPEEEADSLLSEDLQALCLMKVKRSLVHVIEKNGTIHPDTLLYYDYLVRR